MDFLQQKILLFDSITLEFVPKGTVDDKSTLVQVMAWCCQATSQHLTSVNQEL